MTIEEAEVFIEQNSKDPFGLEFKDNEDFEKFLLSDPDSDIPGLHKKCIVDLLEMILAKGGDHDKEIIIYKVLSEYE